MKYGGPAFQVDTPGTSHYGLVCVNLRDYFAAKAMAAIIANPVIDELDSDVVASDSYMFADAMLAVREKGNE